MISSHTTFLEHFPTIVIFQTKSYSSKEGWRSCASWTKKNPLNTMYYKYTTRQSRKTPILIWVFIQMNREQANYLITIASFFPWSFFLSRLLMCRAVPCRAESCRAVRILSELCVFRSPVFQGVYIFDMPNDWIPLVWFQTCCPRQNTIFRNICNLTSNTCAWVCPVHLASSALEPFATCTAACNCPQPPTKFTSLLFTSLLAKQAL